MSKSPRRRFIRGIAILTAIGALSGCNYSPPSSGMDGGMKLNPPTYLDAGSDAGDGPRIRYLSVNFRGFTATVRGSTIWREFRQRFERPTAEGDLNQFQLLIPSRLRVSLESPTSQNLVIQSTTSATLPISDVFYRQNAATVETEISVPNFALRLDIEWSTTDEPQIFQILEQSPSGEPIGSRACRLAEVLAQWISMQSPPSAPIFWVCAGGSRCATFPPREISLERFHCEAVTNQDATNELRGTWIEPLISGHWNLNL